MSWIRTLACWSISLALLPALACCATREEPIWGVEGGPQVVERRELTDDGGRVSWCHADDIIAFDRQVDDDHMEVYSVRPDGSGERCITCDTPDLPKGWRGQPEWHPSCEYLLLVVPGEHFEGLRFEHPSWGFHCDLWLVAADGSWATELLVAPRLGASLHPQFSDDGDQVFWAARASTGETVAQLIEDTPGEESQWDGWYLSVADFMAPGGEADPALTGRVDLYTDQGGFYESHALKAGTLWFSHTADDQPFIDEGYSAALDGSDLTAITASPGTWDEHTESSPGGTLITFNSSRASDWEHPPDTALTLTMEIWARTAAGELVQLTRYNDETPIATRAVTSDYAWGPDGRHIVSYRGEVGLGGTQQIVDVLTLDGAH
jgi:hypothetical protein